MIDADEIMFVSRRRAAKEIVTPMATHLEISLQRDIDRIRGKSRNGALAEQACRIA